MSSAAQEWKGKGEGSRSARGSAGAAQKGLRERISPTCTLSQNGYSALVALGTCTVSTSLVTLTPAAVAAGFYLSLSKAHRATKNCAIGMRCRRCAPTNLPVRRRTLRETWPHANDACEPCHAHDVGALKSFVFVQRAGEKC